MVVDLYEPQTLALVVFGGFVALSFVVYLFSAFGIQEKSYEQAVAEQRARLEKEQVQQREGKRQKRKQFFEKKKREREKHDSSPGILRQEVAQAIDPYVEEVEQAPPSPPPVKEEKVKPAKKPKQPKPPKQAPVEEIIFEAKPAPVQETVAPPKETHTTKSKPPKVVEEQVQKREAPVVHAAAPPQASPAKTKTKTRTAAGDGEPPALRGKPLISAVKSAPLKDAEIQQLIEILLNRQGGSASADDWVKANQRSDPVSALKKQLQEKEQALHNEMLLAQAASQKVKELRHELNHQKEHSGSVEAQYKMKLESQAREVEAFHARMQQSHESHTHDTQALQARIKQLQSMLDESKVDVVNQLREENNRLKTEAGHASSQKEQLMGQELARLQTELQKVQSKLTSTEGQLRQGEEVRRTLETQNNQFKQQRSSEQREGEAAMSKRLAEVSEGLRKEEARNQSLAQAMEAAKGETDNFKGQVSELRRLDGDRNTTLQAIQAKLKDSECQCQNLEGKVRTVESQLAEKEQQKSKAVQEVETLRKEKDSLQEMLRTQEKRSEAEGQEAPPTANGDVTQTDSAPKEPSILLKEHNVMLADKTKAIEGLEEQLNSSKTELSTLQAVIEQSKQRNNNLREKNRKLMDVVSAAEKSRAENAGQTSETLKDEIQAAIVKEQSSVKTVLEKLFPSVSLGTSQDNKNWLNKFEEDASKVLSSKSSSNSQVEEYVLKVNTLEAEKEQLSSQCQHYQSVLADTEGMVNKLQQSVESEEERFEGRIHALEAEKEQLTRELQGQGAAVSRGGQEALKRLEKKNKELSDQNEELGRRVESAEERLDSAEARLRDRIGEMEKEKVQLTAQCHHYQVVLRETESILNKLQSSVESEEINWEEKLNQTESNLGQAKSEVNSLQEELASLSSTQSQKTTENSRLASDLEEAQTTIETLRRDQESAASSYETTSHELEALKAQLHQLKEQLEAANQRVEQSHDKEEKIEETKNKLSSSEAEVKRVSAELEQAKASLADLQSKVASSESQGEGVSALQKQLAEAKSRSEAAEKEVSSLKEAAAAAPAGGDDGAKEKLAKAEEKAAAQQKELTTLNESLKKEKSLTQDLGKAAAKLQVMLKKTQTALNTEKETVAKLKMQNGAAKEVSKQAEGSTSLTESQVELQLADAANEETKQADGTGV
ncbi:ribosome-binding protein 1 isoform X2 [Strongylocentrotus purpuratus]|uniref:Ribosome receptor lysine/proline rich domain-containing protein n=1 Tax=Strongylocentrotus purpuratus TaxID=7668 RepID=A0A7M7HK58_STRPU|nr:ribosome-binding protein 1 isoform X2 [Strongylocentrotus purpuratus]